MSIEMNDKSSNDDWETEKWANESSVSWPDD